jgi:hypothetical protein
MRFSVTAIALTVLAVSVPAQSVTDYVKLRTLQHIVQPCPCQKLDRLIGSKVLELQGVVQGSFKSEDTVSLILKRTDGDSQTLTCPTAPPDWVLNGDVAVRALVKATRSAADGPLVCTVISVAPEDPIRRIDDAYWKKEAAKKPPARSKPLASRSGSGALYGWIGKARPRREWVLPASKVTPIYAGFIQRENPRLSDAKAMEIARAVVGFSVHYGLDARLVMAVLMVESDFDPNSTNSKSGAMGIGQLMPGTADWMGVRNAYDATDNLYGSIKLLRTHLDQYYTQTRGDGASALVLALAAYNAGIGAVKKYGGVPPYRETQAYVARVITIYNRLCGFR